MSTTTTISPARLAANRANAQRSTGPRTPAGKSRSSRNALTHGLSSTPPFCGDPTGHTVPPAPSPLLPTEDPALYAAFRTALLADLAPQSSLELDLADRIVSLHWRLRRCPAIEAELAHRHVERRRQSHEAQQDQRYVKTRDRAPFTPPPAVEFLANQFASLDDRSNPLARLHRYETSLDRTLRRCLADYRTLQLTRLAAYDDEDLDDVSQDEALPNEPTTPSRRGGVSPPSSPFEQNEPTAHAPSDPGAASAPSAPLRFNPSPDLQNEPAPPTAPAWCLGALVVQQQPVLPNEPTSPMMLPP